MMKPVMRTSSLRSRTELRRSPTPVRRSPSSKASPCRQSDGRGKTEHLRDCALPNARVPSATVRSQALASHHAFVATTGGSVASLSGSCIVECHSDASQALRCSQRSYPLACCALSPCGRFLAAGEASMASDGSCHGQGGSNNRPHLLVFDRAKAGSFTQLRGHTHGIQFVAWFPRGSLLVSIGEVETNHFEQQVCLWSWPQGERLASTLSVSGIVDVTVAPDAFCFVTLTAKEARCWSVLHHAGEFGAGRSKSAVQMAGRPLPIELPLHPGAELEGSKNHRHMQEDFVSAAFGAAFALYLITSQGRLMATNVAEEGQHADRHMDLGRKAHAIVWAERLCGEKPSPCGLLVCGLEYGTVEIIDAEHLRTYAMLTIDSAGALESVGVSYSISGEALWVLFSDRSLARWRRLSGKPDRALLSPLPELQECLYTPGCCSPRLVTRSLGSLQSWTVGPDDIKLQPQEAWKVKSHQLMGPSSDMTAFTCSQGIAATGHCNGEVQLLSLPSLAVLGPMPCKHSSDVHAMSFCPWRPLAGVQLLLATASRDGSTMVFRID